MSKFTCSLLLALFIACPAFASDVPESVLRDPSIANSFGILPFCSFMAEGYADTDWTHPIIKDVRRQAAISQFGFDSVFLGLSVLSGFMSNQMFDIANSAYAPKTELTPVIASGLFACAIGFIATIPIAHIYNFGPWWAGAVDGQNNEFLNPNTSSFETTTSSPVPQAVSP